MGPLQIYIAVAVGVLILALLVRFLVQLVTRTCHQCGAKVELGRPRCQACGYRFDRSRW